MSIRQKILLVVSCTFIILFLLVYVFSQTFLLAGFASVEEQEIIGTTQGALHTLMGSTTDLATKLHDWSSWDDTYKFIVDKNQAYIDSNLTTESLTDLGINFMLFTDQKGTLIYSKSVDTQTGKEIPLPQGIMQQIGIKSKLLALPTVSSVQAGVILLNNRPVLIASRPITTSQNTGPIRGAVIFGKVIDKSILQKLSTVTGFPVAMSPYALTTLSKDFQQAKTLLQQHVFVVIPVNNSLTEGYTIVRDIYGRPALLLRVDHPRTIYLQGLKTILVYQMIIGFIGFIICLAILFFLEKLVSSRLAKLNQGVAEVTEKKHIILPGKDEFSQLAQSINTMSDRLQEYSKKLGEEAEKLSMQIKKEEEQNATLEETQKVMVNILEDLEVSKTKISLEKAQDEALLSSIGDGVYAISTESKILYINRQAEELLKIHAVDIIGKTYYDLWDIQDAQGNIIPVELRPTIQVLKTHKKFVSSEYSHRLHDGTVFPVDLSVTPLIVNNNLTGALIVFRDITEKKALDKAKLEFVSLASHQLKTPIGILKWYLEDLKTLPDYQNFSEKVKEYFMTISQTTQRLHTVVMELLYVSRIDDHKVKDLPTHVDVIALTNTVIKEQEVIAKEKSCIVEFLPKRDINPHLFIDAERLRDVIENLISNAIKYSFPNNTIGVVVSQENEFIRLQVTNKGIGIAKKDADKIFSKFFRAENAQLSSTEGSGLGLYIVKEYVEQWSGKIWFESQENKETTFFVEIPIKKENVQAEQNMVDSK